MRAERSRGRPSPGGALLATRELFPARPEKHGRSLDLPASYLRAGDVVVRQVERRGHNASDRPRRHGQRRRARDRGEDHPRGA